MENVLGPCRLPYELIENNKSIDSGYLLSPRDLCSLEHIPDFINSGVDCLKIEGRMKAPEYVATVTRIYRKYIDLALSNQPYIVDENDKKELMQAFNRGMSSSGHLEKEANRDFIFKEKPNNMGLFLGIVQKYNKSKGLITLKLKENIKIGDTISLQNEDGSYTISELMSDGKNITKTQIDQTVTIGRMKGNINLGDKIYKMSSKELLTKAQKSYKTENKKIPLTCTVTIKKNEPISILVTSSSKLDVYKKLNISCKLDCLPVEAKNKPLDENTIIRQLSKTAYTPYEFTKINIDLEENLFLPKLSALNELRRIALQKVEDYAISKIHKNIKTDFKDDLSTNPSLESMRDFAKENINFENKFTKISLLLNILNTEFDYSKLEDVDNLYIPLNYFNDKKFDNILKTLTKKFNTYIYLPTIKKINYRNLFYNNIKDTVNKYQIKGFVISNIGNLLLLNDLFEDLNKSFNIISNYTLNVYNNNTVLELKKLGVSKFTISPESDKSTISDLCNYNYLQKELIVYGKTPLLNISYCLLGSSNKCYPECKQLCRSNNTYYLKDRLNMKFRILPDNIQTVTTVFNCKTTSISSKDFNINFARIDILDEDIQQINDIILKVKSGNRFEGKDYTNGNLNREI